MADANPPVALSPAETQAAVEAAAVGKTLSPLPRLFVSSMLAGAFIAFGALFFCLVSSDAALPFAATRVLGGACFCLGLVLVICCGAELFTGNMLMVGAFGAGAVSWRAVLKNWALVWTGNLAGALLAVAVAFFAQVASMNGGGVGEAMVNVAAGKAVFDVPALFFKGVLCNVFVCLAVRIGFSARSIADKVVGVLLPITAFVACGFEHCVANMFFLPMGLLQNLLGAGAAGAVDPLAVLVNLAVVTLGNVVGGVVVGGAYWFLFGNRRTS
ncbi:MAG TPA: formate/nitrite transporter family protein [Candidatus Aphodovivens avistercoris]|nr:formate/nitrite transporter family protein [Candidatus Aphodovivens avistercoris]